MKALLSTLTLTLLLSVAVAQQPPETPMDAKQRLAAQAIKQRDAGNYDAALRTIAQLTAMAPNDRNVERLKAEVELLAGTGFSSPPPAGGSDIKSRTVDVEKPLPAPKRETAPVEPPQSARKVSPPTEPPPTAVRNSAGPQPRPATPLASAQSVERIAPSPSLPPPPASKDAMADARYAEMKRKIVGAVEEILQLYGNPSFAEVVTNDPQKAADLRARISASTSGDQIRSEVAELEKRRNDMLADIALREREVEALKVRAARLRASLDQAATAIQGAQRAMEANAGAIPSSQ